MKFALIILTISFFMSGCLESKQPGSLNKITPSTNTIPSGGSTQTTPPTPSTSVVGTGSGGGGFIDEAAKQALELAKNSLAQMIENSDKSIFKQFPAERNKTWVIEVIRNIEIINEPFQRYGRNLKFNYDEKQNKIFATKHFIEAFDYGRFYTKPYSEQLSIISELYLDILHELAHFFKIGITEETDQNAELWAFEFFAFGIGYEKYTCFSNLNDKDFAIVLNPASGFAHYGYINQDKESLIEDTSPLLSIPMFDEESDIEIENMMLQILRLSAIEEKNLEDLENSSTFQIESLELNQENQHIFDFEVSGIPKLLEENFIKFESVSNEMVDSSNSVEASKYRKYKILSLDRESLGLTYSYKANQIETNLNLECVQQIQEIRIKEFQTNLKLDELPSRNEI